MTTAIEHRGNIQNILKIYAVDLQHYYWPLIRDQIVKEGETGIGGPPELQRNCVLLV